MNGELLLETGNRVWRRLRRVRQAIRENKEKVIALLKIKNIDAADLIAHAITKDNQRKKTQKNAEKQPKPGKYLFSCD